MKWIRLVLWTTQSGHDSVHRRTYRQGETSVPPPPPPSTSLKRGANNKNVNNKWWQSAPEKYTSVIPLHDITLKQLLVLLINMHWDIKRLYADMLDLLYVESGSIDTGELLKNK